MDDIPEFRLVAEPADEAARALRPSLRSNPIIGSRHKLGGKPDFLQDERRPNCKGCGEPMEFYCQIDAIDDEESRYNLADCGLIYTYVCFDCFEAESFIQSY